MNDLHFVLYVIDDSILSQTATRNFHKFLQESKLVCTYEIVDIQQNPDLAEEEKIIMTPLLVKKSPQPEHRIVGTLESIDKIFDALEIEHKEKR